MSLRLQRTTDVWVTWSCGAFIRWRRETDSMTHILFNAQIINIQEPSRGIGILFVCQLPQNNNNMDTHSSRELLLFDTTFTAAVVVGDGWMASPPQKSSPR